MIKSFPLAGKSFFLAASVFIGGFLLLLPGRSLAAQFQVDRGGTLATNLVAYYKLEDATNFLSTSSYNLTTTGTVLFDAGKVNNAADFSTNNTSSYLYTTSDLGINGGIVSISAWVNVTTQPSNTFVAAVHQFSNGSSHVDYDFWYVDSGGTKTLEFVRDRNGIASDFASVTTTLTTNTWYNLVLTYDGTDIRGYINNTLVAGPASSTGSGFSGGPPTDDGFEISGINKNGTHLWNGQVDEVGIWNKVLDATETTDLYNGGAGQTMVSSTVPAVSLSNLQQYKSDATTTLSEGSTTTETTLVFGANLQSAGTASETLQVEVEPSGTAFMNASSVSSVWVAPSSTVTVSWTPSTGPEAGSNGSYHWQARVLDKSGNTSTWEMYGPNASSTDFVINTIPLYTQVTSTFPSNSSTTGTFWWAPQLLDNITTNTIANFGCLITSVVMDLRAYGITTTTAESYESSTDVNPENFNEWLEQANSSGTGYSPAGSGKMNWMDIPYYAETPSGTFPVWYNFGNDHISSVSSTWINKWLDYSPTATVPVILTEPIISGEQHFIVATGHAVHDNTSTYTIRDPFYYDNDYLNQSTTAHTHNYTNTYSSANILEPLNAPQLPLYLEYEVDSQHTLLITDPSGRRLGTDPQTGIDYDEIPNAGENNDQPGADFLAIYTPAAGQYTLTIGGSGPYQFESFVADGKHRPGPQVIASSTPALSAVTYHQHYDPTNLPASTVQ
jgi:concanavalin A-like lectin/glucanase superfamily protein